MGYRKVPTIYLLEFDDPEYEGLEVRMQALKIGRIRKLITLFEDDDRDDEQMDEMFKLIEEGLLSWNLEDEDGAEVPANMDGINEQELPFIMLIVKTWLDGMTGVDDELGKDSSSGATSRVPLPPMEAL